ncbi:MAG: hypothetical protein V3U30_01480 [Thermoplasmata archaeon]
MFWIPLLVLSALLPGAAAHFPGDDPLQIDGTVLLRAGAGAGFPLELVGPGPVEGGDVLRFEWSVDGGAGPAVRFGISGGGGAQDIYLRIASSDRGEIWLPGSPPYFAGWFNFNDVSVSLAFDVVVLPGLLSPDTVQVLLVFVIAGAAAFVIWRVAGKLWNRQRKIQDYLDSLRKTRTR